MKYPYLYNILGTYVDANSSADMSFMTDPDDEQKLKSELLSSHGVRFFDLILDIHSNGNSQCG
jgi:ABC-type uncharacterized transport system involved in gliding motility auxiliary subunit